MTQSSCTGASPPCHTRDLFQNLESAWSHHDLRVSLTSHASALHSFVKAICRLEQNFHMNDEFLCNKNPIDIRAIADMQQHIGYASCRGLFKGREDTPDFVDFIFHAFFLASDKLSVLVADRFGERLRCLFRGCQPDVPKFMDHVAFRMPMLVLTVAEYLDELLENCCLAAIAALSELRRVVIMAIYVAIMLIVAVLRPENRGAECAREVVDMVFAIESCNVRASQSSTALVA